MGVLLINNLDMGAKCYLEALELFYNSIDRRPHISLHEEML